jgi:hypothetical protein
MMNETKHFAICVRNEGYEGTLELRKLYEIIDDATAARHDSIRVVDESGEDYLYPNDWFIRLDLPATVEEKLVQLQSS